MKSSSSMSPLSEGKLRASVTKSANIEKNVHLVRLVNANIPNERQSKTKQRHRNSILFVI